MHHLTATLTETDSWGTARAITVQWVPEDITERVNPARLNKPSLGRLIAHATPDDPPVYLQRHEGTGIVGLHRVVQSHSGEYGVVTEFTRVDAVEKLAPGTFFIAADTEA